MAAAAAAAGAGGPNQMASNLGQNAQMMTAGMGAGMNTGSNAMSQMMAGGNMANKVPAAGPNAALLAQQQQQSNQIVGPGQNQIMPQSVQQQQSGGMMAGKWH